MLVSCCFRNLWDIYWGKSTIKCWSIIPNLYWRNFDLLHQPIAFNGKVCASICALCLMNGLNPFLAGDLCSVGEYLHIHILWCFPGHGHGHQELAHAEPRRQHHRTLAERHFLRYCGRGGHVCSGNKRWQHPVAQDAPCWHHRWGVWGSYSSPTLRAVDVWCWCCLCSYSYPGTNTGGSGGWLWASGGESGVVLWLLLPEPDKILIIILKGADPSKALMTSWWGEGGGAHSSIWHHSQVVKMPPLWIRGDMMVLLVAHGAANGYHRLGGRGKKLLCGIS